MNPRLSATKIIAKLLRQDGSLSSLLPPVLRQTAARERGLLQELCYGTCRWQPKLDCYLQLMLDKPLRNKDQDVYALLLLGLYQLTELRTPAHAAISETVAIAPALKKPWAKGLVNGVLRRFQREQQQLEQKLAGDTVYRSAHPRWLHDVITAAWPQQADAIFAANNCRPPMTLRVNQRHMAREAYLDSLQQAQIDASATQFSNQGLILNSPCDVEQLPGFNQGYCSVQDEAAQLAAGLLDLTPNLKVLDACCAPGGKTAHMLEAEPSLQCIAIDIDAERIQRTRENLQRLNLNAELKVADAANSQQWWDQQCFDRILLDAPCSATGVIRRHPDIKILRDADNIAKLVSTQRQLLQSLWPLLAPKGLLVYATCSILPQENSEMIAAFVQDHEDCQHQPINATWGTEQHFGRQLLPQTDGPDGFYYAILKKSDIEKDR